MLRGAIYTLKLSDRDAGEPHPHVVAVELSQTQCLIVPCYTPGKPAVEAVIASARRRPMFDYEIFVLVNHADCVEDAPPNYTLTDACYILERAQVMDTAIVAAGKFRGRMRLDQLKRIAQGLLDMNAANLDTRLSKKAVKLLRKLVDE